MSARAVAVLVAASVLMQGCGSAATYDEAVFRGMLRQQEERRAEEERRSRNAPSVVERTFRQDIVEIAIAALVAIGLVFGDELFGDDDSGGGGAGGGDAGAPTDEPPPNPDCVSTKKGDPQRPASCPEKPTGWHIGFSKRF